MEREKTGYMLRDGEDKCGCTFILNQPRPKHACVCLSKFGRKLREKFQEIGPLTSRNSASSALAQPHNQLGLTFLENVTPVQSNKFTIFKLFSIYAS